MCVCVCVCVCVCTCVRVCVCVCVWVGGWVWVRACVHVRTVAVHLYCLNFSSGQRFHIDFHIHDYPNHFYINLLFPNYCFVSIVYVKTAWFSPIYKYNVIVRGNLTLQPV